MCYLIMANAPNWNIENWIHLKLEQYMALLFNAVAQLQIMIIFVERKAILKS